MEKNKKTINLYIIIGIVIALLIVFIFYLKNQMLVFKINDDDITLKVGESKLISYEINNSDAIIEWQSSDSNVASVDNSGLIVGKRAGTVIITGSVNNNEKSNTLVVNVYSGDVNVPFEDIVVPDGALVMIPNSETNSPFSILPNNAYVKSFEYIIDDKSIIDIVDNKISSKNIGTTNLTVKINNYFQKTIQVIVSKNATDNKMRKLAEDIVFKNDEINLKKGETKKIEYAVSPSDGFVDTVELINDNSGIFSIKNDMLTGIKEGKTKVKVIVNGQKEKMVNVNVLSPAKDIVIDVYPRMTIKVGESTNVISHVLPVDAGDQNITYKSSNSNIASVDRGIIKGINSGKATITLSIDSGKSVSFDIIVLPKTGLLSGGNNLWGYQSKNSKIPTRASVNFFQNLAQNGKGTLQGNVYTYTNGGVSYTYNIDSGVLSTSKGKVLVRIYYPPNTDLSTLNTFTYMGGDGEKNFNGFFSDIDKNTSLIKSAGITILVAEGDTFDQYVVVEATKFVRGIINQKNGTKNSIAGFSTGGTKVMWAADAYDYDRVVVFSSYFNWPTGTMNVVNKDVMFYIPNGDHLYQQAKTTLNDMKKVNYSNVTIVTNSQELSNLFGGSFLVVNVGNLMQNGHYSKNVLLAGLFEYMND